MAPDPLPLGEAMALCFAYQHLRGAPLNDQCCIELIVVTPYGAQQQAAYIENLLNNEAEAARYPHPAAGRRYDVALIAFRITRPPGLVIRPLRAYLSDTAPIYGVGNYTSSLPDVLVEDNRILHLN